MRAVLNWREGMVFNAESGNHSVAMDAKAPIGKDSALTPKELVAAGLGGCTAMDVVALLKKYKQLPLSFAVDVDVKTSEGRQPAVFESAMLTYIVRGEVDPAKLMEAVKLSQTKYCGVSAMLSRAFPIHYRVELNGSEIGTGEANFLT